MERKDSVFLLRRPIDSVLGVAFHIRIKYGAPLARIEPIHFLLPLKSLIVSPRSTFKLYTETEICIIFPFGFLEINSLKGTKSV